MASSRKPMSSSPGRTAMKEDCSCNQGRSSAVSEQPSIEPPPPQESNGVTDMSEQKPTLIPPSHATSGGSGGSGGAGTAAPSLTPGALAGSSGGITVFNSDKRVSGLWSINQNRNSWVYITGIGWKRLANNSDSAVVAL